MKKVMSIMFVLWSFSAISGVWDVPILYNGQYVFGYGIDVADIQNISNLATTGGGVFEIPMVPEDFADSPEKYWCYEDYDVVLKSITRSAGYGSAYYSNINSNANVVVRMPSTVEQIGSYAFKGLSELKEVVLPPNIEEIGSSAFSSCGGLRFMAIPDSVVKMGDEVFAGCGALKRVTLSKNCQIIPHNAFAECTRLEEIDIPSGVTSIGVRAFIGCSALKAIIIPDSVTNIDTKAFYNCRNLQTVVIKGKNIRLGAEAFSQCYALKTIDMSCFNEIGGHAFFDCPSIEDISLSADVTISPFAFMGCNGIKNIKIVAQDAYSSGFTNMFFSTKETFDYGSDIEGGAISPVKMETGFIPNIHNLSNVTDFIVSDGATEGNDRLYLPPNTKRCTIPASMTNLTERLIRGGVKYIVDKNNQYYCSDDYGSLFTKDKRKLLAYGNPNRLWHIVGFNGWFGSSVPPEEIGDGAFQNCDNVRWMTFPQGVTKIGARAFKGCAKLESIRFEGPRITKDPFGPLLLGTGKTNVISIINGGPIKHIGESAFADCPNLRCELYFPDTLSTLGDMAFANCPKLSSARFYGATPAVKDIYPEKGVFRNSGVSCEYRFDYTNKWATAMRTYTIVDGQVVTNDNIIGYWQEAHCHPDRIEIKADEIIDYDGSCRLTLDATDGICAVSMYVVESGKQIVGLPDAVRDGWTFAGWWTEAEGGTEVTATTTVAADMTLFAHWTEKLPPAPTYTETTPVPVRHDWLAKYSGILSAAGNDYEAAAMRQTGKKDGKGNALCVWHDYLAGTDPTNANSVFKAKVVFVNGLPKVGWEPDLNDNGRKSERFYKVFGKKTLVANENWTRLADETAQKDYNFFKVTVNMEETPDTEEELKFGDGSGTGGDGVVDDERPVTLAVPANFNASSVYRGFGVYLSWNAVDGAEEYAVYRSDSANFSGAFKVASIVSPQNWYSDEALEDFDTHYYWVRAENPTAVSGLSDCKSAAAATLGGPKNLTATEDRNDGVLLSWSAAIGATSYMVYYSNNIYAGQYVGGMTLLGETDGLEFLDTTIAAGEVRMYKILSLGERSDDWGSCSAVAGARASGSPQAPSVQISSSSYSVYLYWGPVAGATGYEVYRGTANNSSAAEKIAVVMSEGLSTSYSNLDTPPVAGKNYYYWVRTVYADKTSGFSVAVTGGLKVQMPTGIVVSTDKSDGVLVSWNAVEGATSYIVYGKRVGIDSDYVELGSTDATTWLDTTVSQGKFSRYGVAAVSETGTTSIGDASEYGYRAKKVVSVVLTGTDEATIDPYSGATLNFKCTATYADGTTEDVAADLWDYSEFAGEMWMSEQTFYVRLGNAYLEGELTSKQLTMRASYTANAGDANPTVYNLSHKVVVHPAE